MWLPTIEERDLLAYYYKKIGKPNEWKTLSFRELTVSVGYLKYIRYIVFCREPIIDKVLAANERLKERGFIELREMSVDDAMNDRLEVKLTLQGWDIGRKYSNSLIRSGLWVHEYKDHWIWLIIGFLGGIIGAILINLLSTLITPQKCGFMFLNNKTQFSHHPTQNEWLEVYTSNRIHESIDLWQQKVATTIAVVSKDADGKILAPKEMVITIASANGQSPVSQDAKNEYIRTAEGIAKNILDNYGLSKEYKLTVQYVE